jgi:hypothetical protein
MRRFSIFAREIFIKIGMRNNNQNLIFRALKNVKIPQKRAFWQIF